MVEDLLDILRSILSSKKMRSAAVHEFRARGPVHTENQMQFPVAIELTLQLGEHCSTQSLRNGNTLFLIWLIILTNLDVTTGSGLLLQSLLDLLPNVQLVE